MQHTPAQHPAPQTRNYGAMARAAAPHLREIAIVVGAYFAYMYTRAIVFADVEATALANARDIVSLEQSLGFFWEPSWQSWTIDRAQGVVIFFNWAYIVTFLPIVIVSAVIIYVRDRSTYFFYRNVILLTFLFALIAFALFPLAPPRMVAEHFVDTIDRFGPSFYSSREAASYYNSFAAMPSLHFTWTTIFGALFFQYRSPWIKAMGLIYPTMTLFAITITGNHYIADALGGMVVALVSFGTVWYVRRWRQRRSGGGSGDGGNGGDGSPADTTSDAPTGVPAA